MPGIAPWMSRDALPVGRDRMPVAVILLAAAGRRRSPPATPGYLAGRAPRNKRMEYPPDPPRPEEIVRGDAPSGP